MGLLLPNLLYTENIDGNRVEELIMTTMRMIQLTPCNKHILYGHYASNSTYSQGEGLYYCPPNYILRTQLDEDGVEDITMTTMRMIQPAPSYKID